MSLEPDTLPGKEWPHARFVALDYIQVGGGVPHWRVSTVLQGVGDAFECAVFDGRGLMVWAAEHWQRDVVLAWHVGVIERLVRGHALPLQPDPVRLPRVDRWGR